MEHGSGSFTAFAAFSPTERQSLTVLSDQELATIEGEGTIDISILVFNGSVVCH